MADQHFASPPPLGSSPLGTTGCPPVADLIDYALGQITPDERRRIENHLNGANCPQCRGWIEKRIRRAS